MILKSYEGDWTTLSVDDLPATQRLFLTICFNTSYVDFHNGCAADMLYTCKSMYYSVTNSFWQPPAGPPEAQPLTPTEEGKDVSGGLIAYYYIATSAVLSKCPPPPHAIAFLNFELPRSSTNIKILQKMYRNFNGEGKSTLLHRR